MSALRRKQSDLVWLLGDLIHWVYAQGYELTLGEAYRPDRQGHMRGSLHYERLAIDLNLFVDGEYIKDGSHPVWERIGSYWESIGGTWGGRFGDANHFSIQHEGRK